MAEGTPDVTLGTLHDDLVDLKGEIGGVKGEMSGLKAEMGGLRTETGGLRTDVRDLKATVIAGFARMPTREQNEEMLEFVREANRRQEAGFAQLGSGLRVLQLENQQFLRDQHVENQQLLRAQHGENQQLLRAVLDSQRVLIEENRALITRIDAIIRRQNNGGPGG